jgi:integrase
MAKLVPKGERGNRFVVDFYDEAGKRHRIRKRTRAEAKELLGEVLKTSGAISETKLTLKEYAEEWLSTYGKTELRDSTRQGYEAVFKNHIFPVCGHVPLPKIKRATLKRLIAAKKDEGFSRSTIRNALAPLRELFNHAIEDGHVGINPAARLGRFNKKTEQDKKIDPLTKEGVKVFLDTTKEKQPHYYPAFLCAVRTGIRQGELIALIPADLDFVGRFIHVQRNLSRDKIELPKNGRTRKVDMSLQLTNELDALVAQKKADALKREMEKPPEARRKAEDVTAEVMESPLFTNPAGSRLDPRNLRKVFWKTLDLGGLHRVRFHDLRHTYASLLIAQGESLVYVKDQLGHSSISITCDVYGHLTPGGNRRAVDRLDDVPAPETQDRGLNSQVQGGNQEDRPAIETFQPMTTPESGHKMVIGDDDDGPDSPNGTLN